MVKSPELRKFGWNANPGNMPAAYLAGLLIAQKAKKVKIEETILDIGLQKSVKGSRIYAALKGALDGGLKIHCSEDNFPNNDRITGKHIADFAGKLGEGKTAFSKYAKHNVQPTQIPQLFEQVKKKILEVR